MKIGTRSILFGVHAFWWHPIVVLLAWLRLYRKCPNWYELVTIFCHDLGYWGKPDIDGEEGKRHPWRGAAIAAAIVRFFKGPSWSTFIFSLTHSRHTAAQLGLPASALCEADKYSIWFEPACFYLLRARLSGEIIEFRQHAIDTGNIPAGATDREWFLFYRNNVANRPEIKKLL